MPAVRNYTRIELLNALENTRSIRSAAKYLGCSYNTLKRHLILHKTKEGKTFLEAFQNQSGKGISKNAILHIGDYTISTEDILTGVVPVNVVTYEQLKNRLIREGYVKPVCGYCGFSAVREDALRPLLLEFKDGNKKNVQLKNLRFCCYNCHFMNHEDIVINERKIPGLNTFIFQRDENEYIGEELDEETPYNASNIYRI